VASEEVGDPADPVGRVVRAGRRVGGELVDDVLASVVEEVLEDAQDLGQVGQVARARVDAGGQSAG